MRRTSVAPILCALALAGCGGSAGYYGGDAQNARTVTADHDADGIMDSNDSYEDESGAGGMPMAEPAAPPSPVAMESAPSGGATTGSEGSGVGWGALDYRGREEGGEVRREMYAQNTPQRQTVPRPQQTPTPQNPQQLNPQTATDVASGPLLIYEAILNLAVYQVEENQRAVLTVAQEVGGYLARQDDSTVIIRVPADKFRDALARIEALGDVLHRNVQALDVSEEFRDVQIRLRNAEQVRDRLAQLLEQARNVEESLRIEHELERLTGEIESMKGRLRFLQDRIAFSTITVNFSPKEEENLEGEIFHLPFDWLYNLGLRTLLNLR